MGNNNNGSLKDLPKDFDRSVIVRRDSHYRMSVRTLRLAKCDYLPMERNHFRGWFSLPDVRNNGNRISRIEAVKAIVDNGGDCVVSHYKKCRSVSKVEVKILDAYMDNGNVVIHIEPRGEVRDA